MKNAAVILGIIAGIFGMIIGFFVYGYVEFVDWFSAETGTNALDQAQNPQRLQAVGFIAPILAIAGGAMSNPRPLIGAVLLALSCFGMYWGLGFGVFTMFPIAMSGLAALFGLLGLATREPGTL